MNKSFQYVVHDLSIKKKKTYIYIYFEPKTGKYQLLYEVNQTLDVCLHL